MAFQALVSLFFKFEILRCSENYQTTSLGYTIMLRHLMMSEAILTSLRDVKMLRGLIIASNILQHLSETYFAPQNGLNNSGL